MCSLLTKIRPTVDLAHFAPVTPELGDLSGRWSPTIESLTISSNNFCSWRQLPHETFSEGDSGERLCNIMRQFAAQLKTLNICNVLRIRELLRPVWPMTADDREPFTLNPDIPMFDRLETLYLSYSAIWYKIGWYKEDEDINMHTDTIEFRQKISLSAARLAINMPRLRHMLIRQRPMMWAGKHQLEYKVMDKAAKIAWNSTFYFKPWDRTIDAWVEVAQRCANLPLEKEVNMIPGWKTDGKPPHMPAFLLEGV
jgi:hypothetical protein